jgi:spore maturation protein CgeB
MRLLFATARNPRFPTITEYVERAIRSLGHELLWFDDRRYLLPGSLRAAVPLLQRLDTLHVNHALIRALRLHRPTMLLCAGGERILPRTVEAARAAGIRTVLWTIDTVTSHDPRPSLASHYDFVFCGGTEMLEALRGRGLRREPRWLPFACDPELHRPRNLTPEERTRYGCDVAFVGSLHRDLYPNRIAVLEALADFDLGVWGPGADTLPATSPLHPSLRGDGVGAEAWTRIYSAAKLVLCIHYDRPGPVCRQASPRVYEVLACGGFLLCDDQPDVRQLFTDGRELAIFRNPEELRQKIRYYLDHERARREIAERGRAKVLAGHTYQHRLAVLLTTTMGE